AGDEQIGMRLRTVIRDSPTDELIRIPFAWIDLRQETFGANQLLGPTSGRGETNLLVRQLFQGRIVEAIHSHHSFTALRLGPSQGFGLSCLYAPAFAGF